MDIHTVIISNSGTGGDMTLNSPISMLHNNRVRTLLNNMKISKNTPLA